MWQRSRQRRLTMTKKVVAFYSVAFAIAGMLIASPTNALILLGPEGGGNVVATHQFIYEINGACGYTFYYRQLMIIDNGPPMWVATDTIYHPGRYELHSSVPCEGNVVYGVGACDC